MTKQIRVYPYRDFCQCGGHHHSKAPISCHKSDRSIDEFPCHQHMGDSPSRYVIHTLEMTRVNTENLIIAKDFQPEVNFFPPN